MDASTLAVEYRRAIDNVNDRELSADAATVALFMADALHVIAATAETIHTAYDKDSVKRNRLLTTMRVSLGRACKLQGADKLTVKRVDGRYAVVPATKQDGGQTAAAALRERAKVLAYIAHNRADVSFISAVAKSIQGD